MSYRDLLRDSFRITRHNRYLWFFGLFAGTAFNFPSFGGDFGGGRDSNFGRAGFEDFRPPPELLIAIGLVVLLLVLLFIALSVLSQGALGESVAAIDRGQQRSSAWPGEPGPRASGRCSASSSCSR